MNTDGLMPVETFADSMREWIAEFVAKVKSYDDLPKEMSESEWYEQWETFIFGLGD